MRIQWTILKRYFLYLLRRKNVLVSMLVIPIVFTFVFGVVPAMGNHTLTAAVVDQDHTAISRGVIRMIAQTSGYQVKEIPLAQVRNEIRDMKASVVIVLPHGLQNRALHHQNLSISWVPSPNAGGSFTGGLLQLREDLQQWVLTGSLAMRRAQSRGASVMVAAQAFVRGMENAQDIRSPIQTSSTALTGGKPQNNALNSSQRVMIGFAVMFIIFVVFANTNQIFQEKTAGTWARLKASPASRANVLAGYGLGFFVTGWLQFLILYGASRFLFGIAVPLNLWTVLVISLYVLAVCGIALCIAGVVRTGEQHMMLGTFLGIATSMLGGSYWPIDVEPVWMQNLSWFVPQSWALAAFQAAAAGSVSLAAIGLPIAVLAAYAIALFGAGMIQFKYS